MSVLNQYRSNSAGSLQEYATQHKKYESEISSLSGDKTGKETAYQTSQSELDGMTRDEDPTAYDKKQAETETARGSFEEAETALADKQTEFDQYREANPSYASLMQHQSELDEAKDGIGAIEEEATNEETPEQLGETLNDQVMEAENVSENPVRSTPVIAEGKEAGDLPELNERTEEHIHAVEAANKSTGYTPSNEQLASYLQSNEAKDSSLEENLSQTRGQIEGKDNPSVSQPELNERLTPSDDFRDWNPKAEEQIPNNEKLAASMEKAKQQVDNDPSIKEGLEQVQEQDNEL